MDPNDMDDPIEAAAARAASQASMTQASTNSSSSDASSTSTSSSATSHILSFKYLEGHTNKKDLVLRLRKMVHVMQQLDPDATSHPQMDALCHGLMGLVNHRDKEVRLYTVTLCMELFSIYAPDAPWDNKETLEIFRQTIRQLANLAHTTQPTQPHFPQYMRILEHLAEVKIGIVLVDMAKQQQPPPSRPKEYNGTDDLDHDDDQEEDADDGREALVVLKELFRTLLQSVQLEHPPEVAEMVQKTITSCLEEYWHGILVPTQLLDELLVCIGQGRTVLVTNPAFPVAVAQRQQQQKQQQKQTKKKQKKQQLPDLPPRQMEQVNPAYIVAASVVRKSVDRLTTPISTLLNGLLNGDPRIMEESDLLVHTEEPSSTTTDAADRTSSAATAKQASSSSSSLSSNWLDTPQPQQQSPTATVWAVILEFHKIAPTILTTVIGTVATHLTVPDESKRCLVVRLLGRLFASKHSTMAVEYSRCFTEWLKRVTDISPSIRRIMVEYLLQLVLVAAHRRKSPQQQQHASDWKEIQDRAQTAVGRQLEIETDSSVRLHVLHQVCDTAYAHRTVVSVDVLQLVATRVTSKHKQERRDALTGLAQMYFKQYVSHEVRPVQEGGDDVELSVIMQVLHQTCSSHNNLSGPRCSSSTGGKATGARKSRIASSALHEYDGNNDDHYAAQDYYQWIPQIIMKCAFYKDSVDTEMHSRVVQVVDDLLLGSELPHSTKKLTPTARAVGLAFIIDALQQPESKQHAATAALRSSMGNTAKQADPKDGLLWLGYLMAQRSKLQKTVGLYLDARSQIRLHPPGSEEALTANAKAEDLLETVAGLTAPSSCHSQNLAPGERQPILQKFHALKDKHIFRILSTIVSPTHSTAARIRALDELPKRVKQQHSQKKSSSSGTGNNNKSDEDGLVTWVKTLVRRCAMGDFINAETIHHCILLAQECFHEEDIVSCRALVGAVKVASDHFPELCVAKDESFTTLIELFTDARSLHKSSNFQTEVKECGLITALSAILASAAPAITTGQTKNVIGENLNRLLINLCIRDGTPDQARHAVSTMAALLNPKHSNLLTQEQNDAFAPLLKALTSPSRLSRTDKGESTKLVSVLVSLAELAECAPSVFHGSIRGQKAIQFALEMVLLGRSHVASDDKEPDDDESDDLHDEPEAGSPDTEASRRRRKSKTTTPAARKKSGVFKHASPGANVSILEDENLSVSCRTLCSAMEFLVSYIRSSIITLTDSTLASRKTAVRLVNDKENNPKDMDKNGPRDTDDKNPTTRTNAIVGAVSEELIGSVFDTLSQILHDQGLPPSTQDRRDCKLRQDRAALRQCSAINLLRLCDPRLRLDEKFLLPPKWHILANVFLDDERVVRDKVMEEYGLMLTGNGKYRGSNIGTAPRLQMLSLVTLCTDGDHGSDHSAANGNAANVGKRSAHTKMNATNCVESLRKIYELCAAQHRALGSRGEEYFETQMKTMLMPEYAVPYAFHLLAFRRETPSLGGAVYSKSTGLTQTSQEEDEAYEVDDGQHRVLRKRLKLLFDPLVHSLGESADNISFLIRMTEVMGKNFQPRGLSRGSGRKRPEFSPPSFQLSPGSDDGEEVPLQLEEIMEEETQLATAKHKIVCAAAREVLLSYVKKDVNLTNYPGHIRLPATLFQRVASNDFNRRTTSASRATSVPRNASTSRKSVARLPRKGATEFVGDESSPDVSSAAVTSSADESSSRRRSKRTRGAAAGGLKKRPDSLDSKTNSTESNMPLTKNTNFGKQGSDFERPAIRTTQASRTSLESSGSSTVESVARRLPTSRESIESLGDARTGVASHQNAVGTSTSEKSSQHDSFQDSQRETRSKRRTRSSNPLDSSQESNQSSQRSRRTGGSRESIDSTSMAGTENRSSRVHFSPELAIRKLPAQSMESPDDDDDETPFGGDELSPIRMAGSPSLQIRAGGESLLGSGEKTCGTTPPSILRGATMSATASLECGTDHESPLSKATNKSENHSSVEPMDDNNVYHSDDGQMDDEGDGTKTTSETQSSEDPSHSGTATKNSNTKKRPSPETKKGLSKRHKASIPAQIKVSRNKPAVASISSRGGAPRAGRTTRTSAARNSMSSNDNSLDFDGGSSEDEAKTVVSTSKKNSIASRGSVNDGKAKKGGRKKPVVAAKKTTTKAAPKKQKPIISRHRRKHRV